MTDTDTLRKLAEAATPGPWRVSDKSVRLTQDNYILVVSQDRWIGLVMDNCELSEEDAAFIAAANPTAVIALLDEMDALRAKVKVLVEALSDAQNHLDYCGWGDKWERECAIEGKLPNKIASALLTAQEATDE
jgi:hypothetical protein